MALIRELFEGKSFELMWIAFVDAAKRWQFKEINQEEDIPEYLFTDEYDLSHILYFILNSPIPELREKTEFSN